MVKHLIWLLLGVLVIILAGYYDYIALSIFIILILSLFGCFMYIVWQEFKSWDNDRSDK